MTDFWERTKDIEMPIPQMQRALRALAEFEVTEEFIQAVDDRWAKPTCSHEKALIDEIKSRIAKAGESNL